MTTNEIFITMVDWIVDNTEMRNPTETLKKAGLDTANYSKIKSGTNKGLHRNDVIPASCRASRRSSK